MTTTHLGLRIETHQRTETLDITDRIAEKVKESNARDGICLVAVAHTTAGVFVNENADPDVQRDLLATLLRLVPDDGDYRHAEGNAPAHIKSVLVGSHITLAIRDGALDLGRWQGIFFAEFDGPRTRSATVTIMSERAG